MIAGRQCNKEDCDVESLYCMASEQISIEEMDTTVTHAPNTGTPLFAMSAKVQVPSQLSLGQLRRKIEKVAEELDVDIDIKVPLS